MKSPGLAGSINPRAISSNRGFAPAYTHLGDLYLRVKKFEEAVDLLEEAVQVRPDFAAGLNRLSLAYGRLGLINEAADLFALLRKLKLQHGDGKASNFMIHEDRLHLIDLDAMRPSASGWSKDVRRFLDNWPPHGRERVAAIFRTRTLLS